MKLNQAPNKTAPPFDPMRQTRRGWLKALGVLGTGLLGSKLLRASTVENTVVSSAGVKRSCRIAQITDVHVQPEREARNGLVQCLHHIQSQKDAPGFILNTGDCIMDSMHATPERTKLQWSLWKDVLRSECSLPLEHAIGNHDCWGIDKAKSGTTGEEPLWGKNWAMDSLGLAKPYRSFDRNGWHFIALDSIEPFENSYKARLGEEQMAWLKTDLASVSKGVPILVMSHIPIISPGALINDAKETDKHDMNVSGGLMHLDALNIHTLLREQGNVKLCLSGHIHINDRAEFDGITYISSGAVSSGWWKKVHMGRFDYGYSMVDLFENGSFHHDYVPYSWKTAKAAAETKEDQ